LHRMVDRVVVVGMEMEMVEQSVEMELEVA
jgi:hypothetical protein